MENMTQDLLGIAPVSPNVDEGCVGFPERLPFLNKENMHRSVGNHDERPRYYT